MDIHDSFTIMTYQGIRTTYHAGERKKETGKMKLDQYSFNTNLSFPAIERAGGAVARPRSVQ